MSDDKKTTKTLFGVGVPEPIRPPGKPLPDISEEGLNTRKEHKSTLIGLPVDASETELRAAIDSAQPVRERERTPTIGYVSDADFSDNFDETTQVQEEMQPVQRPQYQMARPTRTEVSFVGRSDEIDGAPENPSQPEVLFGDDGLQNEELFGPMSGGEIIPDDTQVTELQKAFREEFSRPSTQDNLELQVLRAELKGRMDELKARRDMKGISEIDYNQILGQKQELRQLELPQITPVHEYVAFVRREKEDYDKQNIAQKIIQSSKDLEVQYDAKILADILSDKFILSWEGMTHEEQEKIWEEYEIGTSDTRALTAIEIAGTDIMPIVEADGQLTQPYIRTSRQIPEEDFSELNSQAGTLIAGPNYSVRVAESGSHPILSDEPVSADDRAKAESDLARVMKSYQEDLEDMSDHVKIVPDNHVDPDEKPGIPVPPYVQKTAGADSNPELEETVKEAIRLTSGKYPVVDIPEGATKEKPEPAVTNKSKAVSSTPDSLFEIPKLPSIPPGELPPVDASDSAITETSVDSDIFDVKVADPQRADPYLFADETPLHVKKMTKGQKVFCYVAGGVAVGIAAVALYMLGAPSHKDTKPKTAVTAGVDAGADLDAKVAVASAVMKPRDMILPSPARKPVLIDRSIDTPMGKSVVLPKARPKEPMYKPQPMIAKPKPQPKPAVKPRPIIKPKPVVKPRPVVKPAVKPIQKPKPQQRPTQPDKDYAPHREQVKQAILADYAEGKLDYKKSRYNGKEGPTNQQVLRFYYNKAKAEVSRRKGESWKKRDERLHRKMWLDAAKDGFDLDYIASKKRRTETFAKWEKIPATKKEKEKAYARIEQKWETISERREQQASNENSNETLTQGIPKGEYQTNLQKEKPYDSYEIVTDNLETKLVSITDHKKLSDEESDFLNMCYTDCGALGNKNTKTKDQLDYRLGMIAKQFEAVYRKEITKDAVRSSIVATKMAEPKPQLDYSDALELTDIQRSAVISTYEGNQHLPLLERVDRVQKVLKGWHKIDASSYEVKITLSKLLNEKSNA